MKVVSLDEIYNFLILSVFILENIKIQKPMAIPSKREHQVEINNGDKTVFLSKT
jgi:hypothetical protein